MYESVFDVIDLRSFSSVWYWIVVVSVWSGASHFTLGVPYDMVRRARGDHACARRDMERLAEIHARRRLGLAAEAGPIGIAVLSAFVTALAVLGFLYDLELAQAILLIVAPLLGLWFLDQRTARAIVERRLSGADLARRLRRLRWRNWTVGLLAILATSIWGMWWNLTAYPLAL